MKMVPFLSKRGKITSPAPELLSTVSRDRLIIISSDGHTCGAAVLRPDKADKLLFGMDAFFSARA